MHSQLNKQEEEQRALTSLALQPAAGHSRDVCSAVVGQVATWVMGQVAVAPGWHSHVGVMEVCPGTPPIHPAPAPVVRALSDEHTLHAPFSSW